MKTNTIPVSVVAQSKTKTRIPKVAKDDPLRNKIGAEMNKRIITNLSIWVSSFSSNNFYTLYLCIYHWI